MWLRHSTLDLTHLSRLLVLASTSPASLLVLGFDLLLVEFMFCDPAILVVAKKKKKKEDLRD